MPKVKIHCENSFKRTGKDFKELHEWMDEPGEILKLDHRRVRHDLSYLDEVKQRWGVEGVKEFLRHISDDYLYSAEMWGNPCATPSCSNMTWHKNKFCNRCLREMKNKKKRQ